MRRLFSTFAAGAPGVGLLVMRLAIAAALAAEGVRAVQGGTATVLEVLGVVIGLLLLVGLWTPIAATLAGVYAAWRAVSNTDVATFYVLLAALCCALALLGPGAWSLDARIFGWKRVVIGNGKRRDSPPS